MVSSPPRRMRDVAVPVDSVARIQTVVRNGAVFRLKNFQRAPEHEDEMLGIVDDELDIARITEIAKAKWLDPLTEEGIRQFRGAEEGRGSTALFRELLSNG